MTPTDDDIARTELLMSAVRIARSDEPGDPDRILEAVAHPALDIADVHRLFATLIEATEEVERLRPLLGDTTYRPSDDFGIDIVDALDAATARAAIAALVLIFGEPEVDASLADAETSAA